MVFCRQSCDLCSMETHTSVFLCSKDTHRSSIMRVLKWKYILLCSFLSTKYFKSEQMAIVTFGKNVGFESAILYWVTTLLHSGSDSLTLNLLGCISIVHWFQSMVRTLEVTFLLPTPTITIQKQRISGDLHARSPSSHPDSLTVWFGQGLLWASQCGFLSYTWKSEMMMRGSHTPLSKEASESLTTPANGLHTVTRDHRQSHKRAHT